jgi:hypothetical protein
MRQGGRVSDSPTYEQLVEQVARLPALVEELTARDAAQVDRIAVLERQVALGRWSHRPQRSIRLRSGAA